MGSIAVYFGLVTILLCSWFYKKYKHVFSIRTFVTIFILVIPLGILLAVIANKMLGISAEVNKLLNYIVNFTAMGIGFILIGIWLILKLKVKNPFWEEQYRQILYTGIFVIIAAVIILMKV